MKREETREKREERREEREERREKREERREKRGERREKREERREKREERREERGERREKRERVKSKELGPEEGLFFELDHGSFNLRSSTWWFPKIGVPCLGVPLRGIYSIWGRKGPGAPILADTHIQTYRKDGTQAERT